ncbi:MAG: phage major capsid protein [Kiritimatiellae bacterium]|nr:phage major capsid protein [Kiritimatiellia bacterium]
MEFKDMTIEQLEERKAAIVAELDAPEADLDALESEMRAIKNEMESRKAIEAAKAEQRAKIAAGAGEVTKTFDNEEKKTMSISEIRASKEYIDAFANYIKTGEDKECRALLTTDASGVVPVPVIVDEIVRTAWENDAILSRVRRTNIRGNLKVAFERSADPAYVHDEGTSAPTEESLLLGIVTMIPKNIKKWITISDEAVAMGGEAFLRYVYDELTYQITKKLAAAVVTDIAGAQTSSDGTHPGQAKITAAPSVTVIGQAFANLSDQAANPVIIMNKLTYADFLTAQAAGNFSVDPFMGLPVLYSSALDSYTAASATEVYAIVGDLNGEQVNYPEG